MIAELEHVVQRPISCETMDKLKRYESLLRNEAKNQNLVSSRTLDQFWQRHVLDSAQLVRFAPNTTSSWLDVGSGAGLPGIVVACLIDGRVTLVEPRRLRADFLHRTCESLGLNAAILPTKVERVRGTFDVITGRAVARLAEFLKISAHLSTTKTLWVLPKGRSALLELAEARSAWHGAFHVEHSATDADSFIVIGNQVRARR